MLTPPDRPEPDSCQGACQSRLRRPVVVALSGGSDSLALLILLREQFSLRADAPPLVAVTVDHGLRPESAAEASYCGRICASLGIEHVVRRWERDPGSKVSSEAARLARYRLLAEVAADIGAEVIATGHTLDDQAETVAMRMARGQGPGLAGMADLTLFGWRTWLWRPLLGALRADLQAMLRVRGLSWLTDPTNEDPTRERVGVRESIAANPGRAQALAVQAAEAGRRRAESSRQAEAFLADAARGEPGTGFVLERAPLDILPAEARETVLAATIATAGGLERLPSQVQLRAALHSEVRRFTLGRCIVQTSRAAVTVRREARNLPAAGPPESGVWDGRFHVDLWGPVPDAILAPLGRAGAHFLAGRDARREKRRDWALRATEPWPFVDGAPEPRLLAPYGPIGVTPRIAPYARFAPRFDLPVARALARLWNALPLPDLPLFPATIEPAPLLGNGNVDAYVTSHN